MKCIDKKLILFSKDGNMISSPKAALAVKRQVTYAGCIVM